MSDEKLQPLRRSRRLKVPSDPPNPSSKHEQQDFIEESNEESSDEEPIPKKLRKKQKMDNKENSTVKKVGQPKKHRDTAKESATSNQTYQSHKPKITEPEKQPEVNEIDEFGDLPELNAPQEWMNLLEAGPSTSKHIPPAKHTGAMEEESSDEEWHEVDVPKTHSSKEIVVEVRVEKKKTAAMEEMEKCLHQEIRRSLRQFQEDSHTLHFYIYLCHLRYQMLRAKNFCRKYKDELDGLVNFELLNTTNPSMKHQLNEFRDRFKKGELPTETTKDSVVERLHSILKNSIFQCDKDLAMAFLILFLSTDHKCRLCIGFTPKPDLPSTVLKRPTKKEETNDEKEELQKSQSKKKKQIEDKSKTTSYWVEYFDELENDWTPVHPMIRDLCTTPEIEKYRPFSHVLGIDKDITVFDLTGWYAADYLKVAFRRNRLADSWIESVLRLPNFCHSKKSATQEAQRLRNHLLSKPLPTVISEYKNHPLYVLEKDLLKFEAIYPKDTKSVGKIRDHNIYPRNSVVTLQGELNWIREARSVKEGEEPYKVVKARPKLAIPVEERVPLFLNTYGYWQTVPYTRPKPENGKIPRNEYGNVYMYKPEMVPIGCVHLRERGVLQMARTLNMEAVPAVVDWEFSGGRNHPVIDGCVVLKKDANVLKSACIEWQQIRSQKKAKAVEERALQLWRRLIKGKLLLEKLKTRFNVT